MTLKQLKLCLKDMGKKYDNFSVTVEKEAKGITNVVAGVGADDKTKTVILMRDYKEKGDKK